MIYNTYMYDVYCICIYNGLPIRADILYRIGVWAAIVNDAYENIYEAVGGGCK